MATVELLPASELVTWWGECQGRSATPTSLTHYQPAAPALAAPPHALSCGHLLTKARATPSEEQGCLAHQLLSLSSVTPTKDPSPLDNRFCQTGMGGKPELY